jgi:RNA polymerase sigma factor (sigma-70 family)
MNESDALALLARRASEGDDGALNELLVELGPQLVRTVRLVVGAGSPTAEDAAQEALIDVMRGIGKLREPTAVRAWAMRVATARALKIARRERLRALVFPLVETPEPRLASAPPDDRLAELKRAFDRLPPRMRSIAVLRLYNGLSERETAAALGCSVGAVKSQLNEARRRLAETLTAGELRPSTTHVAGHASGS